MAGINTKRKVFVAMSGGVDSSVAALLLKNQGYDVVGVFMRCWHANSGMRTALANRHMRTGQCESANANGCTTEEDTEDARRVAEKLQIPFYVWDFEEEYKQRVVQYMIDGYRQGITPNPDVMCNREIKFGIFFDRARAMGADFVATGHYVRREAEFPISNFQFPNKSQIRNSKQLQIENYKLKIAKDLSKDQSYFLWTLTQEKLRHCLFPIGDYLKSAVREMARKAGLPTAEKKDSQGICFLGRVRLDDFLRQYIPEKPGKVLMASGEKIGEHNGAHFYTIGQRHLGINFQFPISNFQKNRHARPPYYVAEKDVAANTIVVAEGDKNPALYRKEVKLTNVNFIDPVQHTNKLEFVGMSGVRVLARVRYRQPLARATLMYADKTPINVDTKSYPRKSPPVPTRLPARQGLRRAGMSQSASTSILFDEPQKFIAPGQSAVFYGEQGEMLGGGIIC